MNDLDPFQSMIAGLRAEGMTYTQIGREAGLSRQSVYRLEVGEAREPSLRTFVKLGLACRAHGLDIPDPVKRR